MDNLKIIPNPDTDKYADVTVSVFNNGGFCPCAIEKNDDTKCPCKDFCEQETEGFCECGRFKKIKE